MPQPDIMDDLVAYALSVTYNLFQSDGCMYEFDHYDYPEGWYLLADRPRSTNVLIRVNLYDVDIG